MKRIYLSAISAIIAGFIIVSAAYGQANGTLSGTVFDPNGAVIPGVTVTARNDSTHLTRTTVTGNDGRWTFTILPVGTYTLSFDKNGFKKSQTQAVEVEASVIRTVETTLEIGTTDVYVDVTSEQPLVQAESAAVARQISGEEVTKLPTSTRSFTGLLAAEAGVSAELSPVGVNGNGNISPSVNGTRTTSTSLFFNGIDATNITSNEGSLTDNIAPAPETLQEVKLQTSLYDASTGRSGGGNFQLVTRSGGNDFRGSVYYYLQNKRFNSNEFFLNKAVTKSREQTVPKQALRSADRLSEKNFSFLAAINLLMQIRVWFRPQGHGQYCRWRSAFWDKTGQKQQLQRLLINSMDARAATVLQPLTSATSHFVFSTCAIRLPADSISRRFPISERSA